MSRIWWSRKGYNPSWQWYSHGWCFGADGSPKPIASSMLRTDHFAPCQRVGESTLILFGFMSPKSRYVKSMQHPQPVPGSMQSTTSTKCHQRKAWLTTAPTPQRKDIEQWYRCQRKIRTCTGTSCSHHIWSWASKLYAVVHHDWKCILGAYI